MAKILGGFAVSHTPTIAFAKDANKQTDPVWAPIFEGFEPAKQWLADEQPDVILYVYNDHMTSFFEHYSHFALGVGAEYSRAASASLRSGGRFENGMEPCRWAREGKRARE